MRLATLSVLVALDGMDGAVEPPLGHFLDAPIAEAAAAWLVGAGARARVEPVEAIVFEGEEEALPRLGGPRVKITTSASEAVQTWQERSRT
jgi:hypothetical protein